MNVFSYKKVCVVLCFFIVSCGGGSSGSDEDISSLAEDDSADINRDKIDVEPASNNFVCDFILPQEKIALLEEARTRYKEKDVSLETILQHAKYCLM